MNLIARDLIVVPTANSPLHFIPANLEGPQLLGFDKDDAADQLLLRYVTKYKQQSPFFQVH